MLPNQTDGEKSMKTFAKVLIAGALALAACGAASAHTTVRVHIGAAQPYYPPLVQVQPRYVAVPAYQTYQPYQERYVDRRAWRHHHHRHHGYCRHHHYREDWRY
jgi:hypothetical protein